MEDVKITAHNMSMIINVIHFLPSTYFSTGKIDSVITSESLRKRLGDKFVDDFLSFRWIIRKKIGDSLFREQLENN